MRRNGYYTDNVVPDTEKLELQKLRTDIEKYYKSRLFLEQHKEDWALLLDPKNTRWNPTESEATWPLKDIISNKERLKEKQRLSEANGNGLGFLGQKPEGVPVDVDDMVRTQVAPVREVIYAQLKKNVWSVEPNRLEPC